MERYYQKEIECASQEQIKAWQDERLVRQVRHVWDKVPYYRSKMEEKGVTPEDIPQRVPYLRVLACNERGREVLRCMKTTAAAPVLTRSADVRRLDAAAQRLFALTARAEEQYVLAYPDLAAARPGSAWTTDPVIL